MLDEVDVRLPDVSVVVDPVEEVVSGAVVVTEPGVLPPLPHDELHLVVLTTEDSEGQVRQDETHQTGLVGRGEGEEDNAHVDPETVHHGRLDPLVVPGQQRVRGDCSLITSPLSV